jgi:NAD(P)H-dependent flavin oxidoreductase YrpB (nitropropane dioxygenase family)
MSLTTPLCSLLSIQHPVLLAGMARVSGAPLAAAVSNAGGLGSIGGLGYTPAQLSEMLTELKSLLRDASLPFGVDLALPQVGGGARKTNHDYTHGQLDELIEVIISNGAKLFISAVGVPPERTIKRLHEAGILVMNMVGAPKHAEKALKAGVDIVCAQGEEGGGHTGNIPFTILIPAVADVAKNYRSPLTGQPVLVVAAGGVSDGRSLAASLMLGASGVWVGTRFIASEESGASRVNKEVVLSSGFGETVRTLVVTGRPLRVMPNEYIKQWEERPEEIFRLTRQGIVPMMHDLDEGRDVDMPFLMGDVSAIVKDIKPARVIIEAMVKEAVAVLNLGNSYISEDKVASRL